MKRKESEEEKQLWRNFNTPIVANIAFWGSVIALAISVFALKLVLGIYQ